MSTHDLLEVPDGLRGVVVARTELGDVRGEEGFYHYRQYSGIELARSRTLEEVWFLLHEGRLPDEAESARFRTEIAELRVLPAELRALLPAIAAAGTRFDPMAGLRTALSLLGAVCDLPPLYDADRARRRTDALLVCAVTPTILAALYRLRAGKEPLEPRPDLSTAANWLYLLDGREGTSEQVRAVETYLVAALDHGMNASTFTARVVASAGAGMAAAVTAAIGTFTGPLHGGAPDRALDGLDEIGEPARIDDWVRARIIAGERIMGFGHAVYRTEDPRAVLLREVAARLGGELIEFAATVERRVVELLAELKPGRHLYANVEFYAGVVMASCGIPRVMFTPTFAVARVIGWTANVLEQTERGRILRPSARYVGPPAPSPLP